MTTFKSLVGSAISLINYVIPVLITLALVFFLYGLVRYVYNTSDPHAKSQDKDIFIWGLLAMFTLVSVWGIVGMLCMNFFSDPSCDNSTPFFNSTPPAYQYSGSFYGTTPGVNPSGQYANPFNR
jgi:hypothetical protein